MAARPPDPGWLADTVGRLTDRHRVPGAQVAVHRGGATATAETGVTAETGGTGGTGGTSGRADRTGSAVTGDVAFPLGSIGKVVTAAAVMVLVADGDVDLDGPVGALVPELDADSGSAPLTPRQLLSHTSGLASSPDPNARSATSIRRYVVDHCRRPALVLPPGAGFSYSNIGYVLAGRLVEAVTGMSWWDAVESIVLRPLGIEPAFVAGPPGHQHDHRHSRRVATGHAVVSGDGRVLPVAQSLAPAEAPAGAAALSAADLVLLGRALLADTGDTGDTGLTGQPALVPPQWAARMRQPAPGADPFGLAEGWGLGLALFGGGWVGHDGTGDGTWCHLRMEPATGTVVAFTSNGSTGLNVWEDLLTELRGRDLAVAASALTDVPDRVRAAPPGCVGSYRNGDVDYRVAPGHDGGLYLAVDGETQARLAFHDDLTFSMTDVVSGQRLYAGRFGRDPVTGDIARLQVTGRWAVRIPESASH